MKRHLPPLNSLRAFEAAARHLSFRQAAEELNVTPAAISQQIKQLEATLSVELFTRTTRALALTDAAEAALPEIRNGFDSLDGGVRTLRAQRDGGILTVSVSPSFGMRWLLPRLERFRQTYPDIDVRIDASNQLTDFGRGGVDVALRYGRGNYKGLTSERLITDIAFPVCSPNLLPDPQQLLEPEDLHNHALLHVDWVMESESAPTWARWLQRANITDIDTRGGLRFSMDDMAVSAAISGLGIVVAARAFVVADLAAGRLVKPFSSELDMPTEFHHYAVYPAQKAAQPKVSAFLDWVRGEVSLDAELYDSLDLG
ncbi:transcriptional regulator GcvA [Pelagibius sp. Alg239-R121]|uniref:transcriptional regulator GcvA n=1 Tax=Pelagibius sp. Alg239-R121 TaxID=2993448 RepID=UPI0024A75BC3|nr:transcriptional regulator GcvA [Pelagibius sp. Alg239-R121]